MTLLDAFVKERWRFIGQPSEVTPEVAEKIGQALDKEVIDISCSYRLRRGVRRLCVHHYISQENDVVFWASPIFTGSKYAGLLFGDYQRFLMYVEVLLRAKRVADDDQRRILDDLQARRVLALKKPLIADEELEPATTTLDLV